MDEAMTQPKENEHGVDVMQASMRAREIADQFIHNLYPPPRHDSVEANYQWFVVYSMAYRSMTRP